ncbi:MAG: M20/M25/M40 family metallo-hydrolase, partial [Thermoplasmata archaeon]|nr:M20/M25/M40 family metallo-hydrolase [Thermoplasmata archaeon]
MNVTPARPGNHAVDDQLLDAAIRAGAAAAFGLLERLVAEPSVVGSEQGAEEVLARDLERQGFAIERLRIPADIGERPGSGVPLLGYDGRYDLVARRGLADAPRRLLLNGHIDVVPADEPDLWSTPPFKPTRRDGWLVGRGTGDMKCGFAMGSLALDALAAVHPASLDWPISVVAAIEEECTGNGTLAAAAAGVLGDAVIVLEPTDLDLLLGGIGIAWFEVSLVGRAGHAESARASVNAFDLLAPVVDALRGLEADL